MAEVNPADVTALRSRDNVDTVVRVVTTMARAYTRGRGFDGSVPTDELEAVITTAAARLASNGDSSPQDGRRSRIP